MLPPLPPVLICSPYQSIKLQLGKQKPLQVSKYEGFSSKELEACITIRRTGHMRQGNCWTLLDDLATFSRLSSLLCILVPRSACICSLLLLHSLDGCLFLADLTQDYGSQGGEYISLLLPSDCREYRERRWDVDTWPSDTQLQGYKLFPWADEQKVRKPLYFVELCFLHLVMYSRFHSICSYIVLNMLFPIKHVPPASLVNSDFHL